jgi:hypothetical protein
MTALEFPLTTLVGSPELWGKAGAPSGPRMPLIAARGPSKPLGRFRSSAARCSPPAGAFAPVAGGVYEVCSLAACGAGRVAVDQVVRLDRLPGDLQEPVLPALGGLGWLVGVSRFSPHRLHRPSCLDSRRTVQESSGGLTFWRRCAQYPAWAGSSGDAPPLTRVCRTISVQDGFGR